MNGKFPAKKPQYNQFKFKYEEHKQPEDPNEKRIKTLRLTGGKIILKLIEKNWTVEMFGSYIAGQQLREPLIEAFGKIRTELLQLRKRALEYVSKAFYWELRIRKNEDGECAIGNDQMLKEQLLPLANTLVKTEHQLNLLVASLNGIFERQEEGQDQLLLERELGLEDLLAPSESKKQESEIIQEKEESSLNKEVQTLESMFVQRNSSQDRE